MAWNQPGGSDNKDPWDRNKNRSQGGSELDRLLRNLQKKIADLFGGKGGGSSTGVGGSAPFLIIIIGVALVLAWLATGLYTVDQAEHAYILRFGKMNRKIVEPGLGVHLPYPFESLEKVNVKKVRLLQVGYRKNSAIGAKEKVDEEALMLTEDENIIDIEFLIKYKITDPEQYLFRVRDPEGTVGQATESAVREVIGRNKLDFVFQNREVVQEQVKVVIINLLKVYKAGVEVVGVEMQNAKPPDEVKEAFNDAIKAREDKQRFIENANAFLKDLVPRAEGEAARMIKEAEGYKESVIKRSEGETKRFLKVAFEYSKAPHVTRKRLYLDMMEQVLSKTSKIYIDQRGGNNLLYLPLDKIMQKHRSDTATPSTRGTTSTEKALKDSSNRNPRRGER